MLIAFPPWSQTIRKSPGWRFAHGLHGDELRLARGRIRGTVDLVGKGVVAGRGTRRLLEFERDHAAAAVGVAFPREVEPGVPVDHVRRHPDRPKIDLGVGVREGEHGRRRAADRDQLGVRGVDRAELRHRAVGVAESDPRGVRDIAVDVEPAGDQKRSGNQARQLARRLDVRRVGVGAVAVDEERGRERALIVGGHEPGLSPGGQPERDVFARLEVGSGDRRFPSFVGHRAGDEHGGAVEHRGDPRLRRAASRRHGEVGAGAGVRAERPTVSMRP